MSSTTPTDTSCDTAVPGSSGPLEMTEALAMVARVGGRALLERVRAIPR